MGDFGGCEMEIFDGVNLRQCPLEIRLNTSTVNHSAKQFNIIIIVIIIISSRILIHSNFESVAGKML